MRFHLCIDSFVWVRSSHWMEYHASSYPILFAFGIAKCTANDFLRLDLLSYRYPILVFVRICLSSKTLQEVNFEECLHKTFEECKQLIISTHAQNNALFGGEPTVDVIKKSKRTEDDVHYYMVGMRTN